MEPTVRIVLVEDDPMQAQWIIDEVIRPALPQAEFRYFDSEFSLLQAINKGTISEWNPDFAIVDLLVCYYALEDLEKMEQSPDLAGLETPTKAGIRCREALQKACPTVKVGIITVLDETPDGFVFRKGEDNYETLIKFLKQEFASRSP